MTMRKLIFIICDGNIIGSGNNRTTPRIVLDILGIDPKLDPEPLLLKSVGEASKAFNYGKVYSGLYEFWGHVVPCMVIVKVRKPTERSKPGNRGKRSSRVLRYLNRVHSDTPMSPLELEIYHQMRNVIGIDPAFYEYIFTVDTGTTVTPDSLNCLVASSADDSSIIGICGETKLENEEGSWWTMIQILPATVIYLRPHASAFPPIAIIMLAVTYGLQAIIFILKREFMLVGWMVVYILSFFLPVYSFCRMDKFGWGKHVSSLGRNMRWRHGKRDLITRMKLAIIATPTLAQNPLAQESPYTYNQASQSGDYYRDTNLTHQNSNPNLRSGGSQLSHSNLSHHGG
ncbi:chitin synthase-domain-containing protein [Infundibulicybe gibba]|nr:chitin synthase-domain-containing protein [Infundibulicybe gibba]